jgi:DNA-binding GntR family transcriptional regulator
MRSQIPAYSLPRIAEGRLLRDRAYDALRDAIVRLELLPGQALTERLLSERLGVSKSPIRDALIRLEREGLVRSSPFKGFEVAPINEAECRNVFQVREALEVYCVDRFAREHHCGALAALEETHREQARLIEAGEPLEAYTRSRFHALLMASLGNPTFLSASRIVRAHVQRIQRVAVRIAGQIEQTHREHATILEAIRARDAAAAAARMRAHIGSVLEQVVGSAEFERFTARPAARAVSVTGVGSRPRALDPEPGVGA